MTIRLVIADDHVLLRAGLVAIFGTEPQLEVVAEGDDGPRPWRCVQSTRPISS